MVPWIVAMRACTRHEHRGVRIRTPWRCRLLQGHECACQGRADIGAVPWVPVWLRHAGRKGKPKHFIRPLHYDTNIFWNRIMVAETEFWTPLQLYTQRRIEALSS